MVKLLKDFAGVGYVIVLKADDNNSGVMLFKSLLESKYMSLLYSVPKKFYLQ